MIKMAPSCFRISQSHPYCHLLAKPPHFTILILRFRNPQSRYDITYLTGLLKGLSNTKWRHLVHTCLMPENPEKLLLKSYSVQEKAAFGWTFYITGIGGLRSNVVERTWAPIPIWPALISPSQHRCIAMLWYKSAPSWTHEVTPA